MPASEFSKNFNTYFKKIVCIVIILCFSTTLFAQEISDSTMVENKSIDNSGAEYLRGKIDGKADAQAYYSGGGWVGGGLAGGFLLGLIGAGVIVGVSQIGSVKPDEELLLNLESQSPEFKKGYIDGYSGKAKSKRLTKSLIGGGIGTACAVVLILSLDKSDN